GSRPDCNDTRRLKHFSPGARASRPTRSGRDARAPKGREPACCDIPPTPLLEPITKASPMSVQKKPLVPPTLVSSTPPADLFERIANALERLAPPHPRPPDFTAADAYIWHPSGRTLAPVPRVNRVDMSLLKGIDRVRDILVENTERFARGLPANNALLWGARGMGKSSLVKATHAAVNAGLKAALGADAGLLKLVEIHREDIESLPDLMALLRPASHRFLVFCDDLSFDAQ